MKQLIILILCVLGFVGIANAQPSSVFEALTRRDSLASGNDSTRLDTVSVILDVSTIHPESFSDTNKVAYIVAILDTERNGANTAADTFALGQRFWADSGCVPRVQIEMRYLQTQNFTFNPLGDSTLSSGTASGTQWISLVDSILGVRVVTWKPFKILPLGRFIEVRIRDIPGSAIHVKRGYREGKWVSWKIVWRRNSQ